MSHGTPPDVVEDLGRLVGFDTVSSKPLDGLAGWLAQRCEDLGFRVESHPMPEAGKSNLLCLLGPEPERPDDGLVLSGHMDVVPTEGQPWTSDPFRMVERDGELYGRGTADMKGFFAATLAALARIPRGAIKKPLALAWTCDEEIGCFGSARLAERLSGRILPSQCLIGEPTDFRILRMHAGHVAVEIEVTGRAAHSSRPHLGVNAIAIAADIVRECVRLGEDLDRERTSGDPADGPWVPINVARIVGGSAINIVPDRCVVQLGYRPPPGMAAEAPFERIRERLRTIVDPVVERYSVPPVEARVLRVTPSMLTVEGTVLERILAAEASAPGTGMAPFATDGGNLAKLGLQPLVFGPGSIEVAHKADEHVSVAALRHAVDVIERVVRARCT